ncbi:glycoside hydrolase family 3 protein [Botryobasidium botryosum FD-172 SS1]|uniref:beta-glucosidase n=1 Tax=Botryobasidium botryosum (strain FD-172 SS1) TaxID=930990 RepID=A0A067MVF6_BOTB1|nr:glycoside hydrolase family 3 protein [Botryobasidium botryosum FD-172 SS1]
MVLAMHTWNGYDHDHELDNFEVVYDHQWPFDHYDINVPLQTLEPTATGTWATAVAKAKTHVAKLTLQQKVTLGTGVGWQKGLCVGNIPSVPSFPGLCIQDGPLGVRYTDKSSAFPAGINAAATWDRDLIRKRGEAIGDEFRGKGIHVALGPMMNLARAPAAGRNWEGFGGDPYLSGEAAYETILGIQAKGVQACAKHYINNEQEHYRDTSSSAVDDRTVSDGLYFLAHRINGTYACENSKVLNGILKGEYGFQGYVMSDWWATHSGAAAVNGGLDMTMPGDTTINSGQTYFGTPLVNAVNSGQVQQSRIDDLATRILAACNKHVDVQGDHAKLIRQIGAASTVLLKNVGGALPLNKPRSIAIIGSDAGASSRGPNGYEDRAGNDGVLAMGWGSGTADYPYLITPQSAITTRAAADGTTVTSSLSDTDTTSAGNAASGKDVAIVHISADSGEAYLTVEGNAGDRNDLKAWHNGDNLVLAVAAKNKNTIVVVHTVGQIIVEPWIDHPNEANPCNLPVTAVLWAGLPGQEAGNSLVDVLYGAVNPSAKLPYTIAKQANDYPAAIQLQDGTINYTEGLNIDYRWFDVKNITPRFAFGFGLSYTTFAYSNLKVTPGASGGNPPSGPGSSLDPWLHTPWATITFTLANSGSVAGTEIPQLYVSPPASANSPPYLLKGFDTVNLAAGASRTVTFTLSRYDLSVWNVQSQRWIIPTGTHGITVGSSSRNRLLTGSIVI